MLFDHYTTFMISTKFSEWRGGVRFKKIRPSFLRFCWAFEISHSRFLLVAFLWSRCTFYNRRQAFGRTFYFLPAPFLSLFHQGLFLSLSIDNTFQDQGFSRAIFIFCTKKIKTKIAVTSHFLRKNQEKLKPPLPLSKAQDKGIFAELFFLLFGPSHFLPKIKLARTLSTVKIKIKEKSHDQDSHPLPLP